MLNTRHLKLFHSIVYIGERIGVFEWICKRNQRNEFNLSPFFQLNTGSATGSFSPMLLALKVSTDKLSNIHNQWTHKLLDLVMIIFWRSRPAIPNRVAEAHKSAKSWC